MNKTELFEIILQTCSKFFDIPRHAIIGKSRNREISEARFATVLILCNTHEFTLKSIGNYLGGRDHSSMVYARDVTNDRLELSQYSSFRNKYNFCIKKLQFVLDECNQADPDQIKIEF